MSKKSMREHGAIFNSEVEARKIFCSPNEKAVIIKENEKISLYGEPSEDEEVIQKLQTGAESLYRNSGAEIVVLANRIVPY